VSGRIAAAKSRSNEQLVDISSGEKRLWAVVAIGQSPITGAPDDADEMRRIDDDIAAAYKRTLY